LKIIHTETNTELFSNSAYKIVQTGMGNADEIASEIIKDGDIQKLPNVTRVNSEGNCPKFYTMYELEYILLKGYFFL